MIDHGNCEFQLDMMQATLDVFEDRINVALSYLMLPDVGYGLSPVGVENVINLLRGEADELGNPMVGELP